MPWRRSTAPDHRFPWVVFCIVLLQSSCGNVTVNPGVLVSDFSSSAAWKWQNTDTFILRGRARLQGENQVFSGPFILVASRTIGKLRADFCGPDGSPLLSLSGDSTGFMIYYPDQATAFFSPGGLPVNNGLVPVNAVIALIRTGFPLVPVPFEMAETYYANDEGDVVWDLSSGTGSMEVTLKQGDLFPVLESGDTRMEVSASSWHDSFNAWPMEWLISSPSFGVVAKLRSIDEMEAGDQRWEMILPVIPDTLNEPMNHWDYARPLPVR